MTLAIHASNPLRRILDLLSQTFKPIMTDDSKQNPNCLMLLGEMIDLVDGMKPLLGEEKSSTLTELIRCRAMALLDRSVAALLGHIVAMGCVQPMLKVAFTGQEALVLEDGDSDKLQGLCAKCNNLKVPDILQNSSVEVSNFLESVDDESQLAGVKRPYWSLVLLPKVLDYALQTGRVVTKLQSISDPIALNHQADSVPAEFKSLPDTMVELLQLQATIHNEMEKITPDGPDQSAGEDLLKAFRFFKDWFVWSVGFSPVHVCDSDSFNASSSRLPECDAINL